MTNKQEKMICNSFGISKLKAFQKDVITDLLNSKDVLGLARTSEGKSICFLSMIAMHPNGLLVGILPTVALMRDLVQRCEDSKIRAGCLYSGNVENTNIIERLKHGKLQALFVAPERLNDPHLWKAIQKNKYAGFEGHKHTVAYIRLASLQELLSSVSGKVWTDSATGKLLRDGAVPMMGTELEELQKGNDSDVKPNVMLDFLIPIIILVATAIWTYIAKGGVKILECFIITVIYMSIELSIRKKFHKQLFSRFARGINDYELVKPGDKIAVCISGGKDSMLMAKLFQELKRHNKFPFELVFLVMDPGYNEANRAVIEHNAKLLGIPITVFETEIFDAVYNVEKSPCYLCARMRRGYLYSKAKELGCNKIALGHHYDDVIETILMGMLYGAQVQTMMPKLHSTNFEGMQLIRPMYLIREADIKHWRDYNDLHFIQCACKFTDTCTTCRTDGTSVSKRMEIKNLIAELKKVNPHVESNIFRSVENVNLHTVIAYKKDGVKHSFLEGYDD